MSATAVAARETSSPRLEEAGVRVRPGPARPRHLRPARQSGRGVGPTARPAHFVPPPRLAPPVRSRASACTVDTDPAALRWSASQNRTRLTERGIAVILVAGVMIVLAAVTVVSLTALRVTGEGAEPLSSYAAQP